MKPSYNQHYWEAQREILVTEEVVESMKDGGDFYPFSRDNFGEAISNMNGTQLAVLAQFTATAQQKFYNQEDSASAGECLRAVVWNYWKDIAKEHFDDHTPEARELFEDGDADTREER